MLTILFAIFFIIIFGKLFLFALKAAWSVFKIIVWIVLLPLFLIGLVLAGLISFAFPILAAVGLVTLLKN